MKVPAVACSLALVLAACGNRLLTTPPAAPAAAVPADTVSRVQFTSPNAIASERRTSAACPVLIVDGRVLSQIEALKICESEDSADISIIKGPNWFMGDFLGKRRRRQLLDSLVQQQQRWAKMRPVLYRIRVVEQGDCIHIDTRKGPARWPRQVVRDTLLVGTEEELRPAEYRNRCLLAWRVEDLFRDLARALADTTVYVHDGIAYDPVYGFPRSYWTSTRQERGWGRFVETFVPAP